MGGDQRNMRGASDYKAKRDKSFHGHVDVNYPDWDTKAVRDRATKTNVKISGVKNVRGHLLRIEGEQSNIIAFLTKSGWNFSDLEKWYPQLFESVNDVEIIFAEDIAKKFDDIKVQALKIAMKMLGTVKVKKTAIDNDELDSAREFEKKQLFSGDGARWFISCFISPNGHKFARVIPSKESELSSYFLEPSLEN